MTFPVTEHTVKTDRHTTGYLACGPQDGPLLVFCHGWPELSLSWRHQLPAFAALGFRCVAPDMRGYGRSSTYTRHEDFAQELIVQDMLELLASLGRAPGQDRAVWIGHDWGSPVVWNMAAHHPDNVDFDFKPGQTIADKSFDDDVWELYHLTEDFNERVNLAAKNPEKLAELKKVFDAQATANHLYPLISWYDVYNKRIHHPNGSDAQAAIK